MPLPPRGNSPGFGRGCSLSRPVPVSGKVVMEHDLMLSVWPGLVAMPDLLLDLRRAIEALHLEVPERDDSALLETLRGLQRAVEDLSAVEAREAAQPVTTEAWQELIQELRDLGGKVGKRQQIAAVGMGMREDFPLPQAQLDALATTTDFEQRLDYVARTDGNPVYVGKADPGSATTLPLWDIQKLTYDSSARLTRVQFLAARIWDDRSTLGW